MERCGMGDKKQHNRGSGAGGKGIVGKTTDAVARLQAWDAEQRR
jgi:hypothetical protein